ncbi:MAG: DUF6883 domain-containing protein [Candidatus Paceibacterota bacterium]
MPFPDAEHAIVTEAKVRDYLLNPNHPVGGPKAVWFASIGYTMDTWQDLAGDLLRLARTVDDFVAKSSPFGVKYEVSGGIGRPGHRPADVISVWIVEENSLPRLITAYPG